VAIGLAFATEVAISLAFADAPVYVFHCVLSACAPKGHLSGHARLAVNLQLKVFITGEYFQLRSV
jgi:hypothetical protein